MTTKQKFAPVLDILNQAVTGDVALDSEYPTIFTRLFKFYEDKGVQFWGDVDEDYAILIDKLAIDLT